MLAFPDGFMMLTGDPYTRTYDPDSEMAKAIGWNCLGADVKETRQPYLPVASLRVEARVTLLTKRVASRTDVRTG